MVNKIGLTEVWDDPTREEFRIATLEETWGQYSLEGEPTRSRTAGGPEEEEDSVRTKIANLEKLVKKMLSERKSQSMVVSRQPCENSR